MFFRNNRNIIKNIYLYFFLVIFSIVFSFPFLWLLSTALKSNTENIFEYPPKFIPEKITLNNFIEVWNTIPMMTYFTNSLIIAFISVILNLVFSSMAAYPLARIEFKGKNIIFYSILSTMMIPFQVIMIPIFIICMKLNLTNTYIGVILPTSVSAFGIFLMRQAYLSIPKELEESALIDGCSIFQIWYYLFIPLTKPSLITLGVFSFVSSWSDFLWPLIILKDIEKYTLPLGISYLMGAFSSNWRLIAAGSIISIIPIIILFIVLQKFFINTTEGAIKG
ncbi:MAG: lactose ABC transporter permease [Candidatus Sericytochromatia bacterium]|nr:MAG: lactose ABC transporter permease [Candidatus Sericytochromatia bacterium]